MELKNVMKKEFTRDCYSVEMEYFNAPELKIDRPIRRIYQDLYLFK